MQFQHLKRETEEIAALTEPKSFSRRVIVSNWERYELPPDVLEDHEEEALDFETLIKSLSDVKGHLKLKHEQSWGSERSELQEDFFNMDMQKLFTSLKRVPYHIRQNLPATLFTQEQLAVFDQDADEARKQSCSAKPGSKEDLRRQKSSIASTPPPSVTKSDEMKPTVEDTIIIKPDVALGTKINSGNEPIRESPQPNKEAKLPESVKTINVEEEAPVTAPSKSDELDLEYLLSLDSAAVEKPNVPLQVESLAMAVATSSKVMPDSGKLDDWLDDLLDD